MTALRIALAVLVAMALPASASRPSEVGLTTREIASVIEARAGQMRACYEKQRVRDPKLAAGGKIVVAFSITGGGRVRDVEVKQPYQRAVDACVKREVRKLVFPANRASPVRVSYPIRFGS